MSETGVPDVSSVAARIRDDDARFCVQTILAEQEQHMQERLVDREERRVLLELLMSVRDDVKFIKDRDRMGSWPVPPSIIEAASNISGSSSSSNFTGLGRSSTSVSSQSSQRKRRCVPSEHSVWLQCPFCNLQHWNEKSHVQHVIRAIDRLIVVCLVYGVTI